MGHTEPWGQREEVGRKRAEMVTERAWKRAPGPKEAEGQIGEDQRQGERGTETTIGKDGQGETWRQRDKDRTGQGDTKTQIEINRKGRKRREKEDPEVKAKSIAEDIREGSLEEGPYGRTPRTGGIQIETWE
jgi:hypothetical protein